MEHEKLKQLSPLLTQASFQAMTSGFREIAPFWLQYHLVKSWCLSYQTFKRIRAIKKSIISAEVKDRGILCSEVIEIGMSAELNCTYRIFSFIEGENARDSIHLLTNEEQYEIGRRAARELSLMHTCRAPSHVRPWDEKVMAKHERYVHAYQSSGVTFSNDQFVLDFIKSNVDAVKRGLTSSSMMIFI